MIKRCKRCSKKFRLSHNSELYCDTCKVVRAREVLVRTPEEREKDNKRARKWRKNNPEKVRKARRKYRKSHLELCRRRTRKNQIELNNRKRFGGLRYKVLKRDNHTCQKCGKDISGKKMACVHHINGDKTDHRMKNLISYCKVCHPLYHYTNGDYPLRGAKL